MRGNETIGVVPAPALCRVPEGFSIREIKYCELCGLPFARTPQPKEVRTMTEHVMVAAPEALHKKTRWVQADRVSFVYRDRGQRFCSRCRPRPFMEEERVTELSEAQERYNMQLPELDKIHLSAHPVRYDQSMLRAPSLSRKRHPEWAPVIVAAFKKTPRMTLVELYEQIPGCYTPTQAYQFINSRHDMKLIRVDKRYPEHGGKSSGVYELAN